MLVRYRLHYGRSEGLNYISHLDLMRFWERAFRRAKIPLAYSEGFTPHPRLSLAAPLPLGISSGAELLDAFLQRFIPPESICLALRKQMPASLELYKVWRLPIEAPSLQTQTLYAEYMVRVDSKKSTEEINQDIETFLSKKEIPWQHSRDTGPRHYNLRPLVKEVRLLSCQEGQCSLNMKLRCDALGSGRPEQVALALGFEGLPRAIQRTRLILKGSSHSTA